MDGKEKLIITDEYIKIDDSSPCSLVMHIGEKRLMDVFAEIGCSNGGHILEIGFGMNLSADAIQNRNVLSHTIIEIHPEIFEKAVEWSKGKKNVKLVLGDWEDVIPKLNTKFDGVLHDAFGLETSYKFLDTIRPICNENCVVVFPFYKSSLNSDIYDVYNFSFTDEEYLKLPSYPYHNDHYFTKEYFEIRYTTFKNGGFFKKNQNKKLF
jgi:hypothetical protein